VKKIITVSLLISCINVSANSKINDLLLCAGEFPVFPLDPIECGETKKTSKKTTIRKLYDDGFRIKHMDNRMSLKSTMTTFYVLKEADTNIVKRKSSFKKIPHKEW